MPEPVIRNSGEQIPERPDSVCDVHHQDHPVLSDRYPLRPVSRDVPEHRQKNQK